MNERELETLAWELNLKYIEDTVFDYNQMLSEYNVKVEFCDLTLNRYDGFLKGNIIVVNENISDARRDFIIAREFINYLLSKELNNSNDNNEMNRKVDYYASRLLASDETVSKIIEQSISNGLDVFDTIISIAINTPLSIGAAEVRYDQND